MKLIINADDCGYSKIADERIANAIKQGKITSTTVMANMSDLEGAVRLFNEYNGSISFGFHLNLTEGSPLLKNQYLLDLGFYQEENGCLSFNGSPFRRRFLDKEAKAGIYREVMAQAETIMDNGIRLSHIDSHHFIHQAFFMIPLLPELCDKLNIFKVRNYWNYYPSFIHRSLKTCWSRVLLAQNRKMRFPKWFSSYEMFYDYNEKNIPLFKSEDVVELMVHPGNPLYKREEELMLNVDAERKYNCNLISYSIL